MRTTKNNETKVKQFANPLADELDRLPLYGVVVRDTTKHEWNPSTSWHKHLEEKIGKGFSMRRYTDVIIYIRIR